jgi:hypothetical protein
MSQPESKRRPTISQFNYDSLICSKFTVGSPTGDTLSSPTSPALLELNSESDFLFDGFPFPIILPSSPNSIPAMRNEEGLDGLQDNDHSHLVFGEVEEGSEDHSQDKDRNKRKDKDKEDSRHEENNQSGSIIETEGNGKEKRMNNLNLNNLEERIIETESDDSTLYSKPHSRLQSLTIIDSRDSSIHSHSHTHSRNSSREQEPTTGGGTANSNEEVKLVTKRETEVAITELSGTLRRTRSISSQLHLKRLNSPSETVGVHKPKPNSLAEVSAPSHTVIHALKGGLRSFLFTMSTRGGISFALILIKGLVKYYRSRGKSQHGLLSLVQKSFAGAFWSKGTLQISKMMGSFTFLWRLIYPFFIHLRRQSKLLTTSTNTIPTVSLKPTHENHHQQQTYHKEEQEEQDNLSLFLAGTLSTSLSVLHITAPLRTTLIHLLAPRALEAYTPIPTNLMPVLFILSSGSILYSVFMHPSHLPDSYSKFLLDLADIPAFFVDRYRLHLVSRLISSIFFLSRP